VIFVPLKNCHPAERRTCFLLKIKRTIHQLGRVDGAEIAEAAVVLPIVFMFLLGIIWFGRAFNIYSTITQAAQQGAITAARYSCGTCANVAASDATVTGIVEGVMKASSLDTNQILVSPNPAAPVSCKTPPTPPCTTTSDKVKVCRNVLLNPPAGGPEPPQCGVIVSFQYPFQFYLPFTSLNMQMITLSAQAQSRMEN
jgi:TadE-like protein